MTRSGLLFGACGVGCHATGCGRSTPSDRSAGSSPVRSVVVYSSADKEFAELIFHAYEQRTGVRVLPLYDTEETKTAGLTARLLAEKDHPNADVFWSSDTSRAVALVKQGIADAYVSSQAADIPSDFKSPDGLWTGFAARIRVMLYNTSRTTDATAPLSILDLQKPHWKDRVAIANPHFGTTSFHMAALFVRWGDSQATAFLRALQKNGVVIAAGNADVKDRVADGRVDVGILDEDDAIVAIRDNKPVAMLIPDQEGPEALGTPLMPNAAILVKGAPHLDEARRFIDFLISPDSERILAASAAAQLPLHPGVQGPPQLPARKDLHVMKVD